MITIREARKNDIDFIVEMIKGIAEYERLSDQVVLQKDELYKWIFDEKIAHVLISELDNNPVGFALYFYNFSTFLGKPGLYLEDIYVVPNARNKGIGKLFFQKLISICKEKNFSRMEWTCLDWNESSISFYKGLGAKPMSDWTTFRLLIEGEDS